MRTTLLLIMLVAVLLTPKRAWAQAGLTVVDFPPTPTTLNGLLAKTDLVILGTVTEVGRLETRTDSDHPRRFQHVQVTQVIKADPINHTPDQIIVRQAGGTVRTPSGDRSYAYPTRLLESNETVVLFLKRVPGHADQYDIAYGKDGLVHAETSDAPIDLPAGLKKLPEFANRSTISTRQFVAALTANRH